MKYDKNDIRSMEKRLRANLINSITGIKPANLIGTKSVNGISNLAIFTSVFHIGSNPPLIGMLFRPDKEVRRHSLENIRESRVYTINHVVESHVLRAHFTSAKFDSQESKFERCGFTEEYVQGFEAPLVMESPIKMGLNLKKEIPIDLNGTILVIGEIEFFHIDAECMEDNGYLDLQQSSSIGVSGLNSYYRLQKIGDLPYARPEELPSFETM